MVAVEEINPECPGFSCPEKERETLADNRSFRGSNENIEKSEKFHMSQRLGTFTGSDGCLLTCPDSSGFTQMPTFHPEKPSVPVQGTPIQPFHQPLHLHSPYKSNRKAMNRNWSNIKANPALKSKTGNK